jgi:hypothetical protein
VQLSDAADAAGRVTFRNSGLHADCVAERGSEIDLECGRTQLLRLMPYEIWDKSIFYPLS